jgi:hypothetical protein
MELALALDGKGRQFLCVFVQLHLPESGSEVQSGKDTLSDFLHRVFVTMGVLVEFPEVLHDPEPLALFLWNAENG